MKKVFKQDESSHWYMIPVTKVDLFEKLLHDEDMTGKECWERDEWQDFENMRINEITNINFENPIEL